MSRTGSPRVCSCPSTSSCSKVTASRCPPPTFRQLVAYPLIRDDGWDIGDVDVDDGVDNEIAGDVLVHLDHDALKDLDVNSVGHRLYLLKQIYNLKIAHGVKFEKDDYVPICTRSLLVRSMLTCSRPKSR
jgi:hypothetical protein